MATNEIKLSREAAKRLADDVAAAGRNVEELISLAVLRELSRERFEIEEVRKGLAEADAGELATDDEVDAVFAKYKVDEAD